jgi:hypothetical protein
MATHINCRCVLICVDPTAGSFFFISKGQGGRCPVCREKLDPDKVNGVGPKNSPYAGKTIHRLCELKLLQAVRNHELEEGRQPGI